MIVKEYKSARAFLDDYETTLLENEAVSQLVLYTASHSCQDEKQEKSIFGAVVEEQDVYLLFADVMPYNLVVYTIKPEDVILPSVTLADYFGNNHVTINGIIANNNVCQNFIEEYKKYFTCNFMEKLGMDIMEIRQVNEIKPIEGTYRLALPEEAKLAAQWMIEFQMEKLTREMDYEAALQRASDLIREGKIHFYEDRDNNVVTMAVAARKLVHGTAITYIFTPEENRGNGYAAANIYYLSKELLAQGNDFCTLFIDKKNPLSNRAYEKVGYKVIGENFEYKMVPVEIHEEKE